MELIQRYGKILPGPGAAICCICCALWVGLWISPAAVSGQVHQIISPQTYGVDFYGDSLFTTRDELLEHPERTESFLKASIKGWGYSLNHPDEVIGLMVWKCGVEKPRAHPGLIDPVFSMDGFIDNPEPEPEPGPDYTLLKQGVVLLVAVLLLLTGGALVLFIYNRKLAAEIEER
ncbi:MAG: ABC transporter substrate-binding protein [Thermodesulfobacteriota bacterium]